VSDEKKLDRIENMLTQLIDIVGKTNAAVSELKAGQAKLEAGQAKLEAGQAILEAGQSKLKAGQAKLEAGQSEIKETVFRIEHHLNIIERKQGKMGTRLDTVEAEVELLHDAKQ
jgi:uncharacterized phage infection (PIP) family protein YhgE